MVKGISRRVVVVDSPDQRFFEQAIFIVRNDAAGEGVTARELEIETVAVYSAADRDALHVQLATRAVCIGPARAAESYLNQAAILTAAVETGCDAVHPGYGFLSENPDFADLCAKCGLKFIGPSGDVIRQMGSKAAAKALMRRSGVPVVPGSEGAVDLEEARRVARNYAGGDHGRFSRIWRDLSPAVYTLMGAAGIGLVWLTVWLI